MKPRTTKDILDQRKRDEADEERERTAYISICIALCGIVIAAVFHFYEKIQAHVPH